MVAISMGFCGLSGNLK